MISYQLSGYFSDYSAFDEVFLLVTVYITTFNRIALLKRAIESVQKQTYPNIEIIVADDGSSDGTSEYLREQESLGHLKAIINDSGASRGACYGRNAAIFAAKGEFITGLDDDDYFETWRIQTFVDKWSKFEASAEPFAGLFDSIVEHRTYGVVKCYDNPQVRYQELRRSNLIGNQVFTKTSFMREINGFDVEMPALQDWDTWLRLTEKFGVLHNCLSFSYVQIHDHGGVRISEKPEEKVRFAFERLKSKLRPVSLKENLDLTYTMYGYSQVRPILGEILLLLAGGQLRRVAQVFKRELLK